MKLTLSRVIDPIKDASIFINLSWSSNILIVQLSYYALLYIDQLRSIRLLGNYDSVD